MPKLDSVEIELVHKPNADSKERINFVLSYLLNELVSEESLGLEKMISVSYNGPVTERLKL